MFLHCDESIFVRLRVRTVITGEDDDEDGVVDDAGIDDEAISRFEREVRHSGTDFKDGGVVIHQYHA